MSFNIKRKGIEEEKPIHVEKNMFSIDGLSIQEVRDLVERKVYIPFDSLYKFIEKYINKNNSNTTLHECTEKNGVLTIKNNSNGSITTITNERIDGCKGYRLGEEFRDNKV